MARTRNLDPGRDRALHYASTARRRHAKRLVYAYLLIVGLASWGRGLPVALAGPAVKTSHHGEPQTGAQAVPCVACVALSATIEQASAFPGGLNGQRVLIRVAPGTPAIAWTTTVAQLKARGGRPGLHLTGIPAVTDPALGADVDVLLIEALGEDSDRAAFGLKQALATARGHLPSATLLVAATPAMIGALRERGLASYLSEFIGLPVAIDRAEDLLAPVERSLQVRVLPAAPAKASSIVAAAVALQGWFPEGLVAVPERSLGCGEDRRVAAFLNPRSLDLVAVTGACPAPASITSDTPGAAVERYDLDSTSAFLVHAGTGERFAEGVNVAAARTLTAEEIVARYQAAAARQAAAIATDIATGTLTLSFEAPGFVAPITITSETTIYQSSASEGRGAGSEARGPTSDVRQANIRVNGVPFNANGGVPRLPIIEPERAAAPPLVITLSDLYRYRLVGREAMGGRNTFVIAFSPKQRGESLYDGRAWIDETTFGMVRVSAAQTQLKGPIIASEQADDFSLDDQGRWLVARSDVRQTYEGASVRTPIHRLLMITRHEINRADFAAQRDAAYQSRDVMLRDTPEGYRYLSRKTAAAGTVAAPSTASPTRVLAGRVDRIRTIAFGVIVDPNISVPLPFAGLSYVDFNLFNTGTQFSGFFGGSYGQLAFSAPSLRGTRWQLAGRAFGIASSYNDRAFEYGREQYSLDIRQRPAQAAVWLLRPISSRTTLRLEYDWDYNRFERADETAAAFVVPRNQNAHTIRLGLDAQRAGWQGSIWGSYGRRIGWRAWGIPGSTDDIAAHADFQRVGASLLRSAVMSPRLTGRVEAAVMGGSDLDRFSRFAFGTFDNRLHGYPSALIRYDRGAVLRTAVAWSALGPLRIDGFADVAAVHDPGFGPGLRPYSGVGGALESPGPFRTLLSLEWGYGFQGIATDGHAGTHVVRLSGYKVF